jgi:pentatricopeptide repeat protein
MKQNNIPINTVTYNTLIKFFGNKGLIDHSIKLFNEMKKNNIPTDTFTYNTLINMFGNKGLIDHSIKLFNGMNSNPGNKIPFANHFTEIPVQIKKPTYTLEIGPYFS